MIWKWILNASKSENETTITFGGRYGVGSGGGGGGCIIMEMDWGSNLKLVRGSRSQVVNLDLSCIWWIHWQLDPVRHSRVLLPIPGETTGVEVPPFTGSLILSLCLILVFLSVLSNCRNPIELIVTTCAYGTYTENFPKVCY